MIERLAVQQPDNGIRASAFRAAAVWDCWAFVRGAMVMPIEAYTLALGRSMLSIPPLGRGNSPVTRGTTRSCGYYSRHTSWQCRHGGCSRRFSASETHHRHPWLAFHCRAASSVWYLRPSLPLLKGPTLSFALRLQARLPVLPHPIERFARPSSVPFVLLAKELLRACLCLRHRNRRTRHDGCGGHRSAQENASDLRHRLIPFFVMSSLDGEDVREIIGRSRRASSGRQLRRPPKSGEWPYG
jgi:hypothetical protein